MNANKRNRLIPAVLMTLAAFLVTDCKASDSDKYYVEYRNNEVSYAAGESCVERYLFYVYDGRYERYIAGMYFGNRVPGINFGTLFETGWYEKDESKNENNVTLHPQRTYNFETQQLDYPGLEGQAPYSATLTDSRLTIKWYVWLRPFEKEEIDIIYTRE